MRKVWFGCVASLLCIACGGRDTGSGITVQEVGGGGRGGASGRPASAAPQAGTAGVPSSGTGGAGGVNSPATGGTGGTPAPRGGTGGVASVSGTGGSGGGAGASGAAAAGSGGAAGAADSGNKASDEVFRDDLLRTYSLTFTTADWDMLQKTAIEEIYVPAMLSVEGETIGKIAVRYKGSFGSLGSCFENGKRICAKLSFKFKFDEYDPNLRYRGLKRLNFHSSLNDYSHLRERVSYKLFREFNILAPRSVHARLMINGEYAGLFNLTEEIDGRFTDYHFVGAEGQGTLYKDGWPGTTVDPAYFTTAQHTNEGTPVTRIVAFATELAKAPADGLGAVVSRYMDPEYVMRYLAVHEAIKHWDGPLTFYCGDDFGCVNHNYFMYESPSQDRYTIVAWDTDKTFHEMAYTDQFNLPAWYAKATNCTPIEEGVIPAGCDRLVQGFVQLGLDKYRAAMGRLLEGPFQVASMQADIDRWAKQIDESVKTDAAGPGYPEWLDSVDNLKQTIVKFRERAQGIRDGK